MSSSSSATAILSERVMMVLRGKSDEEDRSGAVAIADAIRPPWASTIRLAMAMPRPVPLALVVKNGSKIFGRCSGANARSVVAHGDADRGLAVELSAAPH